MKHWKPAWVQSITSKSAPQFYFILYEPGVIIGDDIRFLFTIPERASDYLTYIIMKDRERGERRFFTRAQLGAILRPNWKDFMYFWYPVLEKNGFMACGMKVSEGYNHGVNIRA